MARIARTFVQRLGLSPRENDGMRKKEREIERGLVALGQCSERYLYSRLFEFFARYRVYFMPD